MRKLLTGLFALLMLIGSSAGVMAAQDDEATPADDTTAEAGEVNPRDPQIGDPVIYYSEEGDPVAQFTVTAVEAGWEGYDEYSEPPAGSQYVVVSMSVENLTERSTFEVSEYRFSVQDNLGYLYGSPYVSPEEDLDPPLIESDISLEGEAVEEFSLVFLVYEDIGLNYLYYSDSGILLTLVDLSEI
ncbi:MAG: DUF4352 domain-containing protein [Thermomicrobiales bacterium]